MTKRELELLEKIEELEARIRKLEMRPIVHHHYYHVPGYQPSPQPHYIPLPTYIPPPTIWCGSSL